MCDSRATESLVVARAEHGTRREGCSGRVLRALFMDDVRSRNIPPDLENRLFRKLQMIDDATTDRDLRVPPSNHFEKIWKASIRSVSMSNGGSSSSGMAAVSGSPFISRGSRVDTSPSGHESVRHLGAGARSEGQRDYIAVSFRVPGRPVRADCLVIDSARSSRFDFRTHSVPKGSCFLMPRQGQTTVLILETYAETYAARLIELYAQLQFVPVRNINDTDTCVDLPGIDVLIAFGIAINDELMRVPPG
jgi:hypothetical protein